MAGAGADAPIRLHVFLARSGCGSRRSMEAAIRAGRVQVDGATVTALGTRIDPATQRVSLDALPVGVDATRRIVLALHKPSGVLTTTRDPHGRPTVLQLVPPAYRGVRLYPVGRLDFESEGLVLLTNDGELAHRLMHPRFGHEREYVVEVTGAPPPDLSERLSAGVDIGELRAAKADLRDLHRLDDRWRMTLLLHEGRRRQIRRMCAALKLPVVHLRRVRIGAATLGDLPAGGARELTDAEIAALASAPVATAGPPATPAAPGSGTTPARRKPRPRAPRDRSSESPSPRGARRTS